jgi:hypothetical protein
MDSADFCQLGHNGFMVDREASKAAECPCRLLCVVFLDQIPRRFGEDQQAGKQDERPGQLNGDGDTVRPGVVPVRGGVVDDGGEEQADGDGPLVGTDDEAANPFGSRFRLVERNWFKLGQRIDFV